MALEANELRRLLTSKFGFQEMDRSGDHYWYVLYLEGLKPVKTKVSRGHVTYGKALASRVAKQLGVRNRFYQGMMSCDHSREDYYEELSNNPRETPPPYMRGSW